LDKLPNIGSKATVLDGPFKQNSSHRKIWIKQKPTGSISMRLSQWFHPTVDVDTGNFLSFKNKSKHLTKIRAEK